MYGRWCLSHTHLIGAATTYTQPKIGAESGPPGPDYFPYMALGKGCSPPLYPLEAVFFKVRSFLAFSNPLQPSPFSSSFDTHSLYSKPIVSPLFRLS